MREKRRKTSESINTKNLLALQESWGKKPKDIVDKKTS